MSLLAWPCSKPFSAANSDISILFGLIMCWANEFVFRVKVCVCVCVCVLAHAQLCLTVCDFMDCNLPGSSVHRISQARTLEWVAISRESSQTRDQTMSLGSPTWAGKFFAPGTTWVCSVTSLIGQKLM